MKQTALFAPAKPPDVQRGQVWQLGRHRLMCGDATSKADVAKLFDGRKPTLVVTSPPTNAPDLRKIGPRPKQR